MVEWVLVLLACLRASHSAARRPSGDVIVINSLAPSFFLDVQQRARYLLPLLRPGPIHDSVVHSHQLLSNARTTLSPA